LIKWSVSQLILLHDSLRQLHYYQGTLLGFLAGIGIGWTLWRYPVLRARRLRRMAEDIRRIKAGYKGAHRAQVPNLRELMLTRIPYRMRIQEAWEQFKIDTTPRTAEEVALKVQHEEIKNARAKKQSRPRLVRALPEAALLQSEGRPESSPGAPHPQERVPVPG
jgi:hypothetical protein